LNILESHSQAYNNNNMECPSASINATVDAILESLSLSDREFTLVVAVLERIELLLTAVTVLILLLTPTNLILLTSPFLILLPLQWAYSAYFSQLSRVPGPTICRLTPLWIWYQSYRGHEASLITSLHAKYGPIVRIGPSECVISDGAALNAIYNERGGFRKADCYANFDFEGHATIFSSRDVEYRALRSKAVTPLFSTSSIRAGQKTIEGCVQRFIERIKAEALPNQPVDILNLSRSLALDAVSSYLFGRSYGGIEEKSDRLSASAFVDAVVEMGRFFYLPHKSFLRIQKLSSKLKIRTDTAAEAGGATLESFARDLVRDTSAGDDTYQGRLKAVGISDHEIEVQCMDLMFAGTDSTGTVLSKLIWHLAKSPKVYERLREEVLQADAQDPSRSYNPQSLKYLDAVVREGLRLGMSTPTRFPRIVPKGGWSFAGCYLPEGTQVGCQPHTLHYDPLVFPEPFMFQPERWLDSPTAEMQRNWIPFLLGQRGCLARNLAQFELQLALQAVAREDLLKGATACGRSIEIYEWFSSKVVGDRLQVLW
jgi:cytochrome P450